MATNTDRVSGRDLETSVERKLSVPRFAVTGAVVATLIFALCWLGTFVPLGAVTHIYVQLFTQAEISSGVALVQGVCGSAVFGAVGGALTAAVYNLTAAFDRR